MATRYQPISLHRGLTLIELLVVVAIIGIILVIAVPAFDSQVQRSRRSEALSTLESLALRQEQWRANNPTYGTLANIGGAPPSDFYDFTVVANTAADFRLRATAKGAQLADRVCQQIEINRARARTPATCWAR